MAVKLKNAIEKIKEKYGEDVYDEKKENDYTVIPSGSQAIDNATGVGGWALGKFVELMAWEGTGKTTVAMHAIAEAQKQGLKCVLLDSECGYDFDYGANIGIDRDELDIFYPELVEDAANMTCDLIKTGEVQVIILDSMSALSTGKEKEGDVGDSNMGVKARLVGQFCRKVKNLIKKHQVLLIIIGQLREKMTMYGDPTTTDYGNAVKFFADVRVMLSKKLAKEGDETIGNLVTAKFIKNKLGKPFQKCEFLITFGVGFDTINEILNSAKEVLPKEIFTRRKNKEIDYITYKEEKRTVEEFEQLLRDNEEFKKEVQNTIKQYIK
jgi:recombination protein RecA